ncbi:hypothetical protein [Maribacter arcticus]|uniref:hypothetical protein n=1 Tax=Maribacter arcticus TaxID=561365 RepID=UPI0013562A8D|nr:hypothetical protein [Maribacter arcticus]
MKNFDGGLRILSKGGPFSNLGPGPGLAPGPGLIVDSGPNIASGIMFVKIKVTTMIVAIETSVKGIYFFLNSRRGTV